MNHRSASRRVATRACAACVALVLLAGCGGDEAPPTPAPKPLDVAFLRDLQVWRQERADALRRPDGDLALVGLHWIEPGAHYAGSDRRNGMRLAVGPPHLGMFDLRDGRVRFVPEPGVELTLDGEPLKREAWLREEEDPEGGSVIGFDGGRGTAVVIRSGARLALSVRHADAPVLAGFRGVPHWPESPAWRMRANYVTHAPGSTLEIMNIVGDTLRVANPAYIEFERDKRLIRLEIIEWKGAPLAIFADGTSAKGSFSAGRYLRVEREGNATAVVVDFNRAYNPPCAFTPFSTCPLPPPSNRLDLAVKAGEKAYEVRGSP